VWPVLLAWTHFGAGGEAQDSAGWLSCAKTADSKDFVGGGSSLDVGTGLKSSRWAFLVWAVVTELVYYF
jgi:hypothetical protein